MLFKRGLSFSTILSISTAIVVSLSSVASHAAQADLDKEIDQLLSDFNNRAEPINLIATRIKWSGISDTRLFDPVEERLLQLVAEKDRGFDEVQYVSWLVQMLAFSGQEKYLPTLSGIADGTIGNRFSKKLVRHTESSILVLPDFAKWNPDIYAGLENVEGKTLQRQRTINMLKSEHDPLVRVGASLVFDNYTASPDMISLVNDLLLAKHESVNDNDELAESVAWLCKALGESGNPDYLATLETVKENARIGAVKRWSSKSLRRLKQLTR